MVSQYYVTCFVSLLFWAQTSASFSELRQDIHKLRLKAVQNRDTLRNALASQRTANSNGQAHSIVRRDVSNLKFLQTYQTQLLESTSVLETNTDCTTTALVENIGNLGLQSGEFFANFLIILDDYINGANDCWSVNPFTLIPCLFSYSVTAIKNVFTTISLLSTYISTMDDLTSQITKYVTGNCNNSTTAS